MTILTIKVLPGVLFDSQQDERTAEPLVDLQQPALMKLAGLWLCIRDSLSHSNLPASLQPAVSSKVDAEACLPCHQHHFIQLEPADTWQLLAVSCAQFCISACVLACDVITNTLI